MCSTPPRSLLTTSPLLTSLRSPSPPLCSPSPPLCSPSPPRCSPQDDASASGILGLLGDGATGGQLAAQLADLLTHKDVRRSVGAALKSDAGQAALQAYLLAQALDEDVAAAMKPHIPQMVKLLTKTVGACPRLLPLLPSAIALLRPVKKAEVAKKPEVAVAAAAVVVATPEAGGVNGNTDNADNTGNNDYVFAHGSTGGAGDSSDDGSLVNVTKEEAKEETKGEGKGDDEDKDVPLETSPLESLPLESLPLEASYEVSSSADEDDIEGGGGDTDNTDNTDESFEMVQSFDEIADAVMNDSAASTAAEEDVEAAEDAEAQEQKGGNIVSLSDDSGEVAALLARADAELTSAMSWRDDLESSTVTVTRQQCDNDGNDGVDGGDSGDGGGGMILDDAVLVDDAASDDASSAPVGVDGKDDPRDNSPAAWQRRRVNSVSLRTLMEEWLEMKDCTSGRTFYYHTETGAHQWDVPAALTEKVGKAVETSMARVKVRREQIRESNAANATKNGDDSKSGDDATASVSASSSAHADDAVDIDAIATGKAAWERRIVEALNNQKVEEKNLPTVEDDDLQDSLHDRARATLDDYEHAWGGMVQTRDDSATNPMTREHWLCRLCRQAKHAVVHTLLHGKSDLKTVHTCTKCGRRFALEQERKEIERAIIESIESNEQHLYPPQAGAGGDEDAKEGGDEGGAPMDDAKDAKGGVGGGVGSGSRQGKQQQTLLRARFVSNIGIEVHHAHGYSQQGASQGGQQGAQRPNDTVGIGIHAVVQPGTVFKQTWRVRNTGQDSWEGCRLVPVGGELMGMPTAGVPLVAVPANADADLAVELTAPAAPGVHSSYWRLISPAGERFGQRLWLRIRVSRWASLSAVGLQTQQTFRETAQKVQAGRWRESSWKVWDGVKIGAKTATRTISPILADARKTLSPILKDVAKSASALTAQGMVGIKEYMHLPQHPQHPQVAGVADPAAAPPPQPRPTAEEAAAAKGEFDANGYSESADKEEIDAIAAGIAASLASLAFYQKQQLSAEMEAERAAAARIEKAAAAQATAQATAQAAAQATAQATAQAAAYAAAQSDPTANIPFRSYASFTAVAPVAPIAPVAPVAQTPYGVGAQEIEGESKVAADEEEEEEPKDAEKAAADGAGNGAAYSTPWSCSVCTNVNAEGAVECAMCSEPKEQHPDAHAAAGVVGGNGGNAGAEDLIPTLLAQLHQMGFTDDSANLQSITKFQRAELQVVVEDLIAQQ